ncbi:hypothetical protein ACIQU6_09720 [Streptomyces sp. NPDC090442]|uniref:hypothetical protein n=1 Tax=Streptomyces sp. NPDC090442 TaxID=3365962 RepID=UPI003821D5C5
MAATARTRKTAKSAAGETPAKSSPPRLEADAAPVAPDAAPLEPPPMDEISKPSPPHPYVTPTEVIPDADNLSDVIVDDATGQPPANVDAVFAPLTPFGSSLQCTVRLVERTFLGPHRNPVARLLQPKGAVVPEGIATRIRDRLVAQAARADNDQ